MRRIAAILACIALAACGDSPFSGPVQMAVDPATNNQTAIVAPSDSLDQAVAVDLWRGRDGQVAFRLVTPAYAQTEVDGAPVAGGLVNAVPIEGYPLKPWNPSALTDGNGRAKFWFEPGTKTGRYCAEIRYADGETRLVTDTACAVVEPGPPVVPGADYSAMGSNLDFMTAPTRPLVTYRAALRDQYGNQVEAFRVEGSGWLRTRDTTFGTEDSRALDITCDVQFGDTAGVRIYAADGALMVDAVAQLQHGYRNMSILPGDSIHHTWYLETQRRSSFPRFPYTPPPADSAWNRPITGIAC